MLYEWGMLAEIDDDGMIQDIKYPESGKEYEITDDITKVTPGAKALAADASVKTSEKNATSITLDNSAVKFGVVEKDADFKDMEPGESREGKISLYNNSVPYFSTAFIARSFLCFISKSRSSILFASPINTTAYKDSPELPFPPTSQYSSQPLPSLQTACEPSPVFRRPYL